MKVGPMTARSQEMEGFFPGLEICPGKRRVLKTKEIGEMREFRAVSWFVEGKDTINADNLQEESELLCSKQGVRRGSLLSLCGVGLYPLLGFSNDCW